MVLKKNERRLKYVVFLILVPAFILALLFLNNIYRNLEEKLESLNDLVSYQIDDNVLIKETLSSIQGENEEFQTDLEVLAGNIERFRDENQSLHDRAAGKVLSLEHRIVSLAVLEEKLTTLAGSVQSEAEVPVEETPVSNEKERAIVRLENYPNDGSALLTLGKIFFEEGDVVSSNRYLEKLVELEPFNEEAYALLARISWKEADYDRAVYLYNRLTRLEPENPFYFNNLARACLGSGKLSGAIEALENSLALDHSSVPTLNLAGAVYRQNKSLDLSIEAYIKSLQLTFDSDTASSLGDVFYENGESEEALIHWEAAVKGFDGFSDDEDRKIKILYGKMARLSVETGQFRLVDDFYRSVEERGGDQDVFYFYLSSLLSRGKEKLFEEKLRLFEKRYPGSPYEAELAAMKTAGGGV